MTTNAKKITFTLVHGTFGANSSWLHDTRDQAANGFRARLSDAFVEPVEFNVAAPWGGSNALEKLNDLTNRARLDGAESLSKQLGSLPAEESNFVVAHSHGGNVAMYALQDRKTQATVDGLICLATPFLYPRRRPLSITTLFASVLIMIFGFFQFILGVDRWASVWTIGGSALLFIAAVLVPSALVALIVRQRLKGKEALQAHIERLSFDNPGIPILLIRASGDEASGLLRVGQLLNWLAGIVMRIGGRQLYALMCVGLLCFAWSVYQDFDWIPQTILNIFNTLVILIAGVMLLMLMALTLSRIFIGWDAWPWVGEIETMIEDGPPGIDAELTVLKPRTPESGWLHTTIFTQADTIEAIHRWCESQIQKKS